MEKYPFFDPYLYMNTINSSDSKKTDDNNKNNNIVTHAENIFEDKEELLNIKDNINMKEYFETKYFYYRYLNEYLKYKENIKTLKEDK